MALQPFQGASATGVATGTSTDTQVFPILQLPLELQFQILRLINPFAMDSVSVKAARAVCKFWKRQITRKRGDPTWALRRFITSKKYGWRPLFEFKLLMLNYETKPNILCAACKVKHPRDFFPDDLGSQQAIELCCKEGLKQIWLLGSIRVEFRDAIEAYNRHSTRPDFEKSLYKLWSLQTEGWNSIPSTHDDKPILKLKAQKRKEIHDTPPSPCHFICREPEDPFGTESIIKMATIHSWPSHKFKGVLYQFISLEPLTGFLQLDSGRYKIVLRTKAYITVKRRVTEAWPALDNDSHGTLWEAVNMLGFPLCPHHYFSIPDPTSSQPATKLQYTKPPTQVSLCTSEKELHQCFGTTVCEPCQLKVCINLPNFRLNQGKAVLQVSAVSDLALSGSHSGKYCDKQLDMWKAPKFGPGWDTGTLAGIWYEVDKAFDWRKFDDKFFNDSSYQEPYEMARDGPMATGLLMQKEIRQPSDEELHPFGQA